MDAEIEELALYLVRKLDYTPPPTRILVGIAGIPASGKSTLSFLLTERINDILSARREFDSATQTRVSAQQTPAHGDTLDDQAILVGLDGWHLSRAQLDEFPDPKMAYDRRGSHWTFDGAGYVEFLRRLRDTSTPQTLTAPSFDHTLKDPTPDAVTVHPYHRIVIIEGLYTFLAIHPWCDGGFLLDERWFIDVDPAEGRRRLVDRHVLTGVAKDRKEAEWRADENDVPNGQFIIANMLEPTRVIHSKDIPSLSNPALEVIQTTTL
ncbi:P-loop containing nucleoside triphosphate hydrolase protein [Pholiota conissans]|uniref:P-loop containing nucleoside triphosphate hydrolase protein n=1 Tax=Pholiota conissans TaxID=109636 RepID=A0A9P5Z759_9AGAR|nr:P-loop containing nucleoside triphosphate hydrolase protein [Pholiota conissans]